MHDEPLPAPCRRIGFLVADVGRLLRRSFEQHAGHLGLTQAQWRALWLLSRHEGINQATLSDLLEIQPITVTRLLDRMEVEGWIERRPDPADRRAVRLHLTAQAQPMLSELQDIGAGIIGLAMDGIEPDMRLAMVRSLERMKTNLAAAVEAAGTPRAPIDG
jgi:DNA-binding MarR family transcriptional regulator